MSILFDFFLKISYLVTLYESLISNYKISWATVRWAVTRTVPFGPFRVSLGVFERGIYGNKFNKKMISPLTQRATR
jgi:hypothetical protein